MRTKSYAPAMIGVLTTVTLLLSSCTTKKSTEDTAPAAPAAQAEFVPGEVLVKFKTTVSEAETEFRRAAVFLNQGRVSEAQAHLALALKADPAHAAARQAYVALLLEHCGYRQDSAGAGTP